MGIVPIVRASGAVLVALAVLVSVPEVPSAQAPPDTAIQQEQLRVRRNPWDARAYHRLGEAYIQKARETGDPSYLALAERALRKSLDLAPKSAGATRHLAFVFATRHEFAEAAAQAARAVALDPADGDAQGVLGDAYLELGQYDRAGEAYEAMMRLEENLSSYSRRSGLKALRGDTEGAIADLRRGLAAAGTARQPRESVAWAMWQLGLEHFAIGDLAAAEEQFMAALWTFPGYYRARAGLAQVRVAQRRRDEAAELYVQALAVVPLPEYAAALGDLYTSMGRTAEATRQYELVEYIGQLTALNRVLYNRELAYFYADHDVKLHDALDLAAREIAVRRDVYASDLLAWTLHKAGRSREALAPLEDALRLGTRDARLFFHAGMIHRAAGNPERAREFLARALSTNPHFHVLQAEVAARTLAELAVSSLRAEGPR